MPSTSRPRKPRATSQARIEQILAAARSLLCEKGAANLAIYDVAERAGVPPSSLYHFFPNVPALLEALTAEVHRAFRAALLEPVEHEQLHSWLDLAKILEQRTCAIYQNDPAARQLILAAHGLSHITQVDQRHDAELGQLMRQVFTRHFELPPLPIDIDIFTLGMEISDRLYTHSIQHHSAITERLSEEAFRAFSAYIGQYLPIAMLRRAEPLSA